VRRRSPAWARWPAERLLGLRFSELGLTLEGSWVEGCVAELYEDLERKRLVIRPHVWLAQEWFSPGGIPGIAVPFYLAHPRLLRLERAQMLEVEGGDRAECLRILRHEAGHAIQHAYRLHRRRRWRELFGPSSLPYPEYYRPNPASRHYVQHLKLYYAQSHPDEDFAETFAVWLRPRSDWRKRYADWPVLRKLEYVDQVMQEVGRHRPPVRTRRVVEPISAVRMTLGEHYRRKHEEYARGFPATYDRELRQLFSDAPRYRRHEAASAFLRRNRPAIRRLVARWTGEYQLSLDQVLADMIGRCRELRLRVVGPERKVLVDFGVLLTVKTMHSLYSGRRWLAL
jgi:hypothetical protein